MSRQRPDAGNSIAFHGLFRCQADSMKACQRTFFQRAGVFEPSDGKRSLGRDWIGSEEGCSEPTV